MECTRTVFSQARLCLAVASCGIHAVPLARLIQPNNLAYFSHRFGRRTPGCAASYLFSALRYPVLCFSGLMMSAVWFCSTTSLGKGRAGL